MVIDAFVTAGAAKTWLLCLAFFVAGLYLIDPAFCRHEEIQPAFRQSTVVEMNHEYHEGEQAGENFEKPARPVFRAPKAAASPKQP
jgi:hypothetical protein